MVKTNVKTKQIDEMVELINYIYQVQIVIDEEHAEAHLQWRDQWVQRLHSVTKPKARVHAARYVAELAIGALDDLLIALEEKEYAMMKRRSDGRRTLQDKLKDLSTERDALREKIEELEDALARRPKKTVVTIPEKKVVLRSSVQREILWLMGSQGLGRSWRIIDQILEEGVTKNPNSVRNALRTMRRKKKLVGYYQRRGKPVRWKPTTGGNRQLVVLTETGREAFCQTFEREAVESELDVMAREHSSVEHGVGILEAREHLRAAGYRVDDNPEAILADEEEPWHARVEPDLVAVMDGDAWPVEVQREVSTRLLDKWQKALEMTGRLAIILFNEDKRKRQERLLRHDRRRLPQGEIWLTSLEAMEEGEWSWRILL
jgi:hypothetical protein